VKIDAQKDIPNMGKTHFNCNCNLGYSAAEVKETITKRCQSFWQIYINIF
jgi:hypothetical protein